MLTIIQILAFIFFTFVASRAVLRAKDKKISLGELIFWLGIWGGMIFVVFFPDIISKFANLIGIGRGIDVIIYASIAILFYLIFRLYVKLEESEREITRIVREVSFLEKKKK
jgi:small membrane protein